MSTTEKYLTKSERSQVGIDKALGWVKENMSTTDYQPVDRQRVADSLGIALSSINRVMLVLEQQGYLSAKRAGSTPLYRVVDQIKLKSVMLDQAYAWIQAYNRKHDERAKQKKLAARAGKNDESTVPAEVEEAAKPAAHAETPTTSQKEVTLALDPSLIPDKTHPRSEHVPQKFVSLLDQPSYRRVYEAFKEEESAKTPAQKLLAEALKLVEAEQNSKSEPEVLPEQLKGVEDRLNRLENSTNIILYFFQQASTVLRSLPPAQLPVVAEMSTAALPDLEPTKRAKINRLVDGYAAAKTVSHQEVWKHLYGHLSSRFGFDAWQHAQTKKNPNYLEIVEENGQLENLYSIAAELLTLSQR